MSKRTEMEIEFRDIFSKLMSGSRSEFKEAKKKISRLWHADSETFQKAAPVTLEYIARFDEIKEPENQAAFASGLSFIFLAIADEYFESLKVFTLKLLQHPHGHVREAMRHTADWLHMSLSARTNPFIYPAGKELTDGQKVIQVEARKQYISLVKEIEMLMEKHDAGADDVEYVDEMKPSVEKSLQQFWNRLTEGGVYRKLVEQTRPIPTEIYLKRKGIEHDLLRLIMKTGDNISIDDVLDAIYHEEGSDDFQQMVAMFNCGGNISELSSILEILTDAWNYFPHKSLDDMSPVEKSASFRLAIRE